MEPEKEIAELDAMVTEREELIFAMHRGAMLTEAQLALLERIVSDLTPF